MLNLLEIEWIEKFDVQARFGGGVAISGTIPSKDATGPIDRGLRGGTTGADVAYPVAGMTEQEMVQSTSVDFGLWP